MGDIWQLRVYRKAVTLADDVRRVVLSWDALDRWTIGVQAMRAADSIGANLAEGYGRETDRDRLRFLVIARGSATETEHWLERASARRLIADPALTQTAREVCRMLNGLIASCRP